MLKKPRRGDLQVKTQPSMVGTIWRSREQEPDLVETYQLCDREWQTMDGLEKEIDNRDVVQAFLYALPRRKAFVLRMRFFEGLTLEQIGDILGIQKERVRQIELEGIRRIKHWCWDEKRFNNVVGDFKRAQKKSTQTSQW